jgi:hypothetical protein
MGTCWGLVIDYAASPAIACVLNAYVGAFGAGAFTHLIMVFLMCVVKPKIQTFYPCSVVLTLTVQRLIWNQFPMGLWAGSRSPPV